MRGRETNTPNFTGLLRVIIENEIQVNNLPGVESEISYRFYCFRAFFKFPSTKKIRKMNFLFFFSTIFL